MQGVWTQTFFSDAQLKDKRQKTQTRMQDVLFKYEEALLYCEGDQALVQIASRSC